MVAKVPEVRTTKLSDLDDPKTVEALRLVSEGLATSRSEAKRLVAMGQTVESLKARRDMHHSGSTPEDCQDCRRDIDIEECERERGK